MSNLFKLDDQVCGVPTNYLIAFLFVSEDSFFAKAGVNLHVQHTRHLLHSTCIMLHLGCRVFNFFHWANVEFSKGALNSYFNVGWLVIRDLVQATESITEHATIKVATIEISLFIPWVGRGVNTVIDGLWALLHKVSTTVTLSLCINDSFFETKLPVLIVNGPQMHYKNEIVSCKKQFCSTYSRKGHRMLHKLQQIWLSLRERR